MDLTHKTVNKEKENSGSTIEEESNFMEPAISTTRKNPEIEAERNNISGRTRSWKRNARSQIRRRG